MEWIRGVGNEIWFRGYHGRMLNYEKGEEGGTIFNSLRGLRT